MTYSYMDFPEEISTVAWKEVITREEITRTHAGRSYSLNIVRVLIFVDMNQVCKEFPFPKCIFRNVVND